MTLYGWDASHYDGVLTTTIMATAKGEGITFFSHKIGEGLSNDDPLDATCLAAARTVGIKYLGGYYIPHQGLSVADEVDRCIFLADRDEPWWRNHDYWFWQCDAERWSPTDRPTFSEVKTFCDLLKAKTGKTVICYASRGQYGEALTGLGHPLWNASYGANSPGPFKSLYPGDGAAAWLPYSGQVPVFWQYSSAAIIAGLTTCDANAYRGTESQLAQLIGARVALTQDDLDAIFKTIWYRDVDSGARVLSAGSALLGVYDRPPATVDVNALAAAIVAALPSNPLTEEQVVEACKTALESLQIVVSG